ncbi:tyrosine-protein phosphatase [Nocardia salmonicida]|uniref:tyrosine-protein phosphatase n=1 Tax=Nocardia salmonicida TaxID=53431 RepID=UPI0033D530C0
MFRTIRRAIVALALCCGLLAAISCTAADPQHPVAADAPRLAGADNFRDIAGTGAGYVAQGGHHVRKGAIYRSNALTYRTGGAPGHPVCPTIPLHRSSATSKAHRPIGRRRRRRSPYRRRDGMQQAARVWRTPTLRGCTAARVLSVRSTVRRRPGRGARARGHRSHARGRRRSGTLRGPRVGGSAFGGRGRRVRWRTGPGRRRHARSGRRAGSNPARCAAHRSPRTWWLPFRRAGHGCGRVVGVAPGWFQRPPCRSPRTVGRRRLCGVVLRRTCRPTPGTIERRVRVRRVLGCRCR